MSTPAVLEFLGVWKSYPQAAGGELHALRDVCLRVARGAKVAIIGRSGSGKSTFLHLAAGIDEPSRGEVRLLGRSLVELTDRERTLQRLHGVGLVFQFFHLLPHLSVLDNVILPGLIAGDRRDVYLPRADELLRRVGLLDRASESVERLSGGEMQRVAICRALLRRPSLVLADEPTGNLDDENGRVVMDLLLRMVDEEGSTLIYVTHSRELAGNASERWRMRSGLLEPA
jgi:predicted ABC-type transport system involved in lysophospholipase L1 biosynthesis ATPase subunit